MQVDGSVVDDPDWASVSDVARQRGVTRQAISKRVKALAGRGKLSTQGEGRNLRFHLPTFESLTADSHDPAQDLRNRHQRSAPTAEGDSREDALEPQAAPARAAEPAKSNEPSKPSAYDSASTREKNAKAELAEIRLAQERSALVRVQDIEPAASQIFERQRQVVLSMKPKYGRIYAAGVTGGEDAGRIAYDKVVDDVLVDMLAELQKLHKSATGAL